MISNVFAYRPRQRQQNRTGPAGPVIVSGGALAGAALLVSAAVQHRAFHLGPTQAVNRTQAGQHGLLVVEAVDHPARRRAGLLADDRRRG